MEATVQGATTTSQVEENIVVESGDQFTSYRNPLAQQPPVGDTSFHGPVEGHVDSPVCLRIWSKCSILGNLYEIGHCFIWSK